MVKIFKTVKEAEDYYRNNPSKQGDRTNIFGNKPPGRASRNYEHELQVRCIQWFDNQFANGVLFAIPNGGHRRKATAAMLKAEGVRAGVPDLFYALPNKHHSGLFIELKVKPNKATDSQLAMMNTLTALGYCTELIYTFEEFKECIISYFNNN